MSDTPTRDQGKFIVRMPDGMRDRIREEAEKNNRSMNSEIVARLEASFSPAASFGDIPHVLIEIDSDKMPVNLQEAVLHVGRIASLAGVDVQSITAFVNAPAETRTRDERDNDYYRILQKYRDIASASKENETEPQESK